MKKKLIIAFFTGAITWHFFLICLQTLIKRGGIIGGEILFLPLIVLMFYLGWIAREEANI